MHLYILLYSFLFVALTAEVNAQNDNAIHFINKPWETVLELAADSNKPVLLYLHASWCVPCRRMEREVLNKGAVGRFYNKHFISYTVDVDTEAGRRLVKQYNYNGLPAFMFLTYQGELLEAIIGYRKTDAFIAAGRKALTVSTSLAERYQAYKSGESGAKEWYDLAFLLKAIQDKRQYEVASAYINTLHYKDLLLEKNWTFFSKFITDIHSPYFRYVIDHTDGFYKKFGKRDVNLVLTSIALEQVTEAAAQNDSLLFDEILKFLDRYAPSSRKLSPSENRRYMLAQKQYYHLTKNWDAYAKAASTYIEQHSFRLLKIHLDYATSDKIPPKFLETSVDITFEQTKEIVSEADTFYTYIDDGQHLESATRWVSKVIATIDTINAFDIAIPCTYYLTHAKLLAKQGRMTEAYKAAQYALQAKEKVQQTCKEKATKILKDK